MKTVEEYEKIARAEINRQLAAAERAYAKERKENPAKFKNTKERSFPPSFGLSEMLRAGNTAMILAVLEDVQELIQQNDGAPLMIDLVGRAIENLE